MDGSILMLDSGDGKNAKKCETTTKSVLADAKGIVQTELMQKMRK